jgi:hypothetical protein
MSSHARLLGTRRYLDNEAMERRDTQRLDNPVVTPQPTRTLRSSGPCVPSPPVNSICANARNNTRGSDIRYGDAYASRGPARMDIVSPPVLIGTITPADTRRHYSRRPPAGTVIDVATPGTSTPSNTRRTPTRRSLRRVIPVATPGTSTPATTRRRTTRHSVVRGDSTIPTRRAQTPASVTVPTRHHHNTRTSSRRNTDGASSVNDAIVDAAEEISVVEPVLDPNAERYCYCDRPSNTYCAHCSNGACSINAYVQCTGPCERWFHPECDGWKVHRNALGDPTHIVPGWDNPTGMSIPLSTNTQGGTDIPFWCIK